MSEITCFVWRTSWLCACFLAIISVILFQISPKIRDPCRREDRSKFCWRFCSDEAKVNELHTGQDQINNFCVWSVHDSSRWGAGSDSNIVLSKPESPGRAMRMPTAVTQSLRQGKRLNWTRLTMSGTPKWKYRKMFRALKLKNEIELFLPTTASSNDSFRQRTAKSVSATDGKTEFLNMEIVYINYVSKGRELFATENTAIHLGLTNEKNMEILKYRNFENVENSFTVNENLVMKILRKYCMWVRMTTDHRDQVKKWSKTKVRVYSDSVLCLGRMISSREEAKEKWSIQVGQFKMYSVVKEFYEIDGEAIEFEWKISQNNITYLMRDPEILTMSERWIRTILWQDHIHVNVQRTA